MSRPSGFGRAEADKQRRLEAVRARLAQATPATPRPRRRGAGFDARRVAGLAMLALFVSGIIAASVG
ncbi:MAG: hypothetical protein REI09_03770 [Candidatus Dactylopiibacterium sp.]|nr:hypothetical protein [Candidatus Dactylopiibacterium sp.]